MSENKNSQTLFQASIYYGVLLAVIGIMLGIVNLFVPEEITRKSPTLVGLVTFIISILITVYVLFTAIKSRKEAFGGFISFGQGVNMSFWIGTIYATINTIWSPIYMYVINPNILKDAMNQARLQMENAEPKLTDEQIEIQMKMIDFFMSPYFNLPIGFIFIIIFTVLTGLIVAGILQKEKEHPF